ncbi:hypothetical protein Q31b_24160 [Novipirellula aureliae]|uniref:Formylmethanofuran dehydrogenase subunit B n=1 Tax=Novipirellula aureliae TaxID=2527966 RepID=A0A5C6E5Z3_9BACT|nr:hypothetical protein [Novipirellula aureliae]TWU43377.1 hypothetical protein Q31b_24160 [Novipirellula aureliae]
MTSLPPIVCPFCAIHCDDILLGNDRGSGGINLTDCERAAEGYHSLLDTSPPPRLGSESVAQQLIFDFAAEHFANRSCLNVVTCGTDLSTAKTLQTLAGLGKIKLWIDETVSEAAWRTATSREGNVTATIGDIRRHADLIWLIGDVAPSYPRLLTRLDAKGKQVVASEQWDAESLAELYFRLRQSDSDEPNKLQPDKRTPAIRNASYLAIVIGPNAFAPKEAISVASLLAKMVWYLNRNQRAVTLQIDRAATNRSLTAWRSNASLPSITDSMSSEGTVDIRLGNALFDKRMASLQIGGVDDGRARAQAYLPASTAGIDTTAMAIRGDSTVSLSLEQQIKTSSQTVGELLARLVEASG